MSYFVYWCIECGKSFREVDVPLRCDECDGDIDHDEREEDESWKLKEKMNMENKTENNRMFDHCQTDRCEECTDKKRCCEEAWKKW